MACSATRSGLGWSSSMTVRHLRVRRTDDDRPDRSGGHCRRSGVDPAVVRSSVKMRGPAKRVADEGDRVMAQYLVLIYEDEAASEAASEAAGQAGFDQVMKEHIAFGENNAAVIWGGNALQPAGTATSIRKDAAGTFTATDGPFAETKEALGGYYLIEAADLDEALAVAKQVPALFGGVEVRPVRTFD
nr:YciI family protein [Candidatus Frankia alpina]